MKNLMAAVIVGPTIGSSVSVFASERGRCRAAAKANALTAEAVKARMVERMVEQGYALGAIRAERGCFEITAVDGARLEPDVDPETGLPLKPDAGREDRS